MVAGGRKTDQTPFRSVGPERCDEAISGSSLCEEPVLTLFARLLN